MATKQKIGLGTVQFGTDYGISNKRGKTPVSEVSKILHTAREHRVRILDTASAYGMAEKVLGEHDLSGFRIVSKFMPSDEDYSITVQLEKTLSDLNASSLYGYLAHRPQNLVETPETWTKLKKLRKDGKVRKIGFSLNSPGELHHLLDMGMNPDIIQAPYSYFDRRFESEMQELQKDGCEIHARSAFLQGLFFTETDQLAGFFDSVKPIIKELQGSVQQLPVKLLHFVLEKPFIDHVIIGVETKDQLLENLKVESDLEQLPVLEIEFPEQILTPSNWPKSL